jgi:opacity protein-like surface antigen
VVDGTSLTFLEEITVHARLAVRALAAVALSALTASAVQAQASAQQAPQVSVTGVVYTQYQYSDAPIAAKSTFDMTRAYVNVLGRLANGINTRVTLDIIPSAATNQVYRLKFAYAAWTPARSSLTYKLGMINTPWVDFEETLWDYRMQGTIAVDRNVFPASTLTMSAADIGFGVDGRWNNDRVNAQFAIVNGEGYAGGTGDFRKDVEARVSYRIQPTNDNSRVGGLRLSGYLGVGKATGGADRNRYLGMLSYRTTEYTVAGEYVSVKNAAVTGSIISAFAVYHLDPPSKIALIARVDIVDPDNNVANNGNTRIIGGASYQLSPNVRMLADIDRVKPQGGTAVNQFLIQAQFVF